jgi:hypothetical protein
LERALSKVELLGTTRRAKAEVNIIHHSLSRRRRGSDRHSTNRIDVVEFFVIVLARCRRAWA